jgi:hypothetical protein
MLDVQSVWAKMEPTCPLHGAISGLRWQDADNPKGLGLAESYPPSPPEVGGEVPLVERQTTKAWMEQLHWRRVWQKVLPDGDSKRSVRLKNWRPRVKAINAWMITARLGARWASQHPVRHYSAGFHANRALTSGFQVDMQKRSDIERNLEVEIVQIKKELPV